MRDAGVSIESLIQQGRQEEGGEVLVAMVAHEGPQRNVERALELLRGSDSLTAPPLSMQILGTLSQLIEARRAETLERMHRQIRNRKDMEQTVANWT